MHEYVRKWETVQGFLICCIRKDDPPKTSLTPFLICCIRQDDPPKASLTPKDLIPYNKKCARHTPLSN